MFRIHDFLYYPCILDFLFVVFSKMFNFLYILTFLLILNNTEHKEIYVVNSDEIQDIFLKIEMDLLILIQNLNRIYGEIHPRDLPTFLHTMNELSEDLLQHQDEIVRKVYSGVWRLATKD